MSRFSGGRTGHDRERGFYKKFQVERVDGREDKHPNCEYFVLDLDHDKFARPAIEAYANACEEEFPALAKDLRKFLNAS